MLERVSFNTETWLALGEQIIRDNDKVLV